MATKKTQKTEQDYEIPIPTRSEFMRNLVKVSKTKPKTKPQSPNRAKK